MVNESNGRSERMPEHQLSFFEIVDSYTDSVVAALRPEAVVLFGPHAEGCATERTPIDIAVIVDGVDDCYEAEAELVSLAIETHPWLSPVLVEKSREPKKAAELDSSDWVMYRRGEGAQPADAAVRRAFRCGP